MLKSLNSKFHAQWDKDPLLLIIILAFLIRFISAIFSQGYGMHDDHFLAVETPWSWTVGEDYEGWLPESQEAGGKMEAQNITYASINYLQFAFLKIIGIDNPKVKMFFLRLLLALFSLIAVKYAYKITEKLANKKTAVTVGFMLALFWFMPFLSVRNLVEIVAIPFLFWGSWMYIKRNDRFEFTWQRMVNVFFAGFIIAIAMAIRYQVGIFLFGMGLALLIQRKWMDTLFFGVGAIAALLVTHGLVDLILWGKPFIQMKEYVLYNLSHKGIYGNQDNVLMYIELILGLLIPPVSIFIFFGFFRIWKKHLFLFLPNFLFLAFHTYFPNRQERFIFTIIPMVIMLGMIGWNGFVSQSVFWQKRPVFLRNIYRFFWIINIILLIPVSLTYSKKSRVEAMAYFYPIKDRVNTVLVDDTGRNGEMMMPVLYTGKPLKVVTLPEDNPNDTTNYSLIRYQFVVHSMHVFKQDNGIDWPEYIIFVEDIDLEKRVEYMRNYFPDLEREAYIQPSLGDRIMKRLNPANKNEEFYIYKTNFKS